MKIEREQGFLLSLLFALLIAMSLFAMPVTAEEAMTQAREAAVSGLGAFLDAIPEQDLKHFNFSDPSELALAELGDPFRVYTIPPEAILDYTPGTSIGKIVSPTSLLLFPVISRGETRTLLMVDEVAGEWKAVGIGSSGLAKQWEGVIAAWPSAKGYEHTFIRIFQATADFVLLSRDQETKMIPLESGRVSLGLPEKETFAPSEIIFGLQKPVFDNIEASRFIN